MQRQRSVEAHLLRQTNLLMRPNSRLHTHLATRRPGRDIMGLLRNVVTSADEDLQTDLRQSGTMGTVNRERVYNATVLGKIIEKLPVTILPQGVSKKVSGPKKGTQQSPPGRSVKEEEGVSCVSELHGDCAICLEVSADNIKIESRK